MELCIGAHDTVVCDHILEEFRRHLQGKFHLSAERARQIADHLRAVTACVAPASLGSDACRDPDDLPVLGALVSAEADCLVTGDKDLLALGQFAGRLILSPRQLLDRLRERTPQE